MKTLPFDLTYPVAILLVFYLYVLVKSGVIKRPFFYAIGALGLLVALASAFFIVGSLGISIDKKNGEMSVAAVMILANIFQLIGVLVAVVGAIASCYAGKLPVNVPGAESKEDAS